MIIVLFFLKWVFWIHLKCIFVIVIFLLIKTSYRLLCLCLLISKWFLLFIVILKNSKKIIVFIINSSIFVWIIITAPFFGWSLRLVGFAFLHLLELFLQLISQNIKNWLLIVTWWFIIVVVMVIIKLSTKKNRVTSIVSRNTIKFRLAFHI